MAARRFTETSLAVAAVRGMGRGMWNLVAAARQTQQRIAVGLRSPERTSQPASGAELETLLKDSRVVRALITVAGLPLHAWRHSRARGVVDGVAALDLAERIRLIGIAALAAIAAHPIVLAAIGVHTFALGWTTRAVAAGAALALVARPEPFAAAWKDRVSR